jgi:tRNA U34 5-carboxymethylaminomethyl modifying enzyme MnmG/GidA
MVKKKMIVKMIRVQRMAAMGIKQKEEQDVGKQGKLLVDATCVPADIRYPTDLGVLNEAREKLEKIIWWTIFQGSGMRGLITLTAIIMFIMK